MKTYNFFRGKQTIRKDEFKNYVPENWEDQINEDNEFHWGEFKAVLISEECECENCEGTGMVEQFAGNYCGRSIANCCGGCYDDVDCDECDGSGITIIEY